MKLNKIKKINKAFTSAPQAVRDTAFRSFLSAAVIGGCIIIMAAATKQFQTLLLLIFPVVYSIFSYFSVAETYTQKQIITSKARCVENKYEKDRKQRSKAGKVGHATVGFLKGFVPVINQSLKQTPVLIFEDDNGRREKFTMPLVLAREVSPGKKYTLYMNSVEIQLAQTKSITGRIGHLPYHVFACEEIV